MRSEHHRIPSEALGRPLEVKLYGSAGQPVIVFPTSGGRFHDFEDQGMVKAAGDFIEAGRLRILAVDGIDNEAWLDERATAASRVVRADAYDRCIAIDVIPWLKARAPEFPGIGLAGCSMGAFHAANFYFRHPEGIDWVVALSGVYDLGFAVGHPLPTEAYFHSPLHYLPNLAEARFLDRYRESRLVFCVGQGRWEEQCLADTRRLQQVLHTLQVPAWFDIWGHDVDHDWPWWRRQWPHFLNHLV